MGKESEAVLLNASADEGKVYDTIIAKFDSFFKVRRNVIFKWAVFNCRVQAEDEAAEQFIMELYKLAEACEYGDMTEQMIRD